MLTVLSLLSSCSAQDKNVEDYEMTNFTMKAELLAVNEKLEVDVIEAEYASGIFHIIVTESTEIYDSHGKEIEKSDLTVGSILTIDYSGQVMMSYPPQTVALVIRVN